MTLTLTADIPDIWRHPVTDECLPKNDVHILDHELSCHIVILDELSSQQTPSQMESWFAIGAARRTVNMKGVF